MERYIGKALLSVHKDKEQPKPLPQDKSVQPVPAMVTETSGKSSLKSRIIIQKKDKPTKEQTLIEFTQSRLTSKSF